MKNDILTTRETKITLTIQQLEEIIRKVVREELVSFITEDHEIFNINERSPLCEDLRDILDRKKSDQLKFHSHEEIWGE